MIAELSINKKRALVCGCIVFALIIHIAPLRVRVYTRLFGLMVNEQEQHVVTHSAKPVTLTRSIPTNILKQLQATRRATAQSAQIQPAPVTKATPVLPTPAQASEIQKAAEPEQTTHKIFRAGTGFDAPMTEDALSLEYQRASQKNQPPSAQARPVTQPKQIITAPPTPFVSEQSQTPAPRTPVTPAPHAPEPSQKSAMAPAPHTQLSGRLALKTAAHADEIVKIAVPKNQPPDINYQLPPPTHTPVSQQAPPQQQGLSFLSQQNFENIMRDGLNINDLPGSPHGTSQEYVGSFYGASATHNQYGDPRFLHYNSKIYHALQQSMTLAVNMLSPTQYRTMLDGVRTPTRIRFALDQDGNVISVTITRSSGNLRYDNIAYKIVQEGSYPSIPKSFGLTRTYHQYGIILYDIGADSHQNIGVAPYLEGE